MSRPAFAATHARDRLFFLVFVLAAWLAVMIGFAPSIASRLTGTSDYPAPWVLIIHVWSFFGWLTLLTAQVALVRGGRLRLHRKLGIIGILLVPVMAFSGVAAEIYGQRFYASQYPDNIRFFPLPAMSMIMFTGIAAAAFAIRRDSATHKRLILIATAIVLSAAYFRWWGDSIDAAIGAGFWGILLGNYAGTNLIIAICIVYDVATRGRIHPSYAIAVPIVLLGEIAAVTIHELPGWPATGRLLLGL